MTNSAPRRDNGLHAPSYDRLRDVETHLVDGLLDRLRDIDVAAYSAPTPGRRGPYGDTVIPQAEVEKMVLVKEGDTFSRAMLEFTADSITTMLAIASSPLWNRGYGPERDKAP